MAGVINVHNILFPKVFFAITIITSNICDDCILRKYAWMDSAAEVLKILPEAQFLSLPFLTANSWGSTGKTQRLLKM